MWGWGFDSVYKRSMMTQYASLLLIRRVKKSSPRNFKRNISRNDGAFAFLSMFTFCEETYAFPDDAKATTMKEIKEPMKDIKEAITGTASKDVKDAIKAAKDAKKSKKDCARECGNDYDPICVHDPADSNFKPRTFGTQCTLDVHNCEMGTKLAVKSKGECPGSGGVKLS